MGAYSPGLDRYLNRDDVTLKASGAEAASTTQAGQELGDKGSIYLVVDVTAASGTPTLLVTIEGSNDGATWFTVGKIGSTGFSYGDVATAPTVFSTTGTIRGVLPAARFMRSKSTIGGGTPSFTYSVAGNAA